MSDLEVFPPGVVLDSHRGMRNCRCGVRWIGSTPNGDWVFVHRAPPPVSNTERILRGTPVEEATVPPTKCMRPDPQPGNRCGRCGQRLYRVPSHWKSKTGWTHEAKAQHQRAKATRQPVTTPTTSGRAVVRPMAAATVASREAMS